MAFTWAVFQSNVFLPKLNTMRIPVSFHTALKTAELSAFLDSGATECFISQRFIDKHKLGTRLLTIPRKLQNADGSPNTGGGLTHFTELEVFTGDKPHRLRFYIADMGPDDLVLGYPWFAATNVQPNWTDGTLPTSVTIHTRCYDLPICCSIKRRYFLTLSLLVFFSFHLYDTKVFKHDTGDHM